MRILFLGSRSFGAACLTEVDRLPLARIIGVGCDEDDKAMISAAKSACASWYPIISNAEWVAEQGIDLIMAAHYTRYIPIDVVAATRLGALVGHPSLLPRHRGRSAVEWTIRMHDPIAGFTWFWADGGLDTGPIAKQDWCHVRPDDTASSLWSRELFPMGVRLAREAVAELNRGLVTRKLQDEAAATYEPPIVKAKEQLHQATAVTA